jgi:tetratricopeptide (TPR) repeat protein
MKKLILRYAILLILMVIVLGGCSGKTAGGYYKDGLKYFKSGEYEKAEENFIKAVELNEERAEYYIEYAMTLIQLSKYDEAIQNLDKAILNKNNMIVNKNNKLAYRGKGIAYYKSYNYVEAITWFDKALVIDELTDLNMDILYYKGSAQQNAGLYEEAIETYTAILQNNPNDAITYNSRAFVYRKLGDFEKSLTDYEKAIGLESDVYDYYFGKYFLLLDMDDKDGAKTVLENAANIKLETQEDKFNLAKVHYYMGDYDSAIAELGEAFRNGFSLAYFYLGDIYEKKEDYETAVYNYGLYLDDISTDKSAVVYNQMGICLIKLGRYNEALSYIRDGLSLNDLQFNQSLKRNEIVALENLSNFEEAYKLMNDYVNLYPDDEEALEEYEFLITRLPEVSPAKDE